MGDDFYQNLLGAIPQTPEKSIPARLAALDLVYHGGPLPLALYSAALFSLTEGRAYSAAEYRQMLRAAGLKTSNEITPTLIHCGFLTGGKR